jgi:hypothetical protein
MAVRADDGKGANRLVERAGDAAGAVLDREKPVLVEQRHPIPPIHAFFFFFGCRARCDRLIF